ncbi:hypothetical protein NP590_13090 [Methylomonas sp. SURF-2]|uniref:Uncharacterized protein n=1 Tax=Methylomonas subterranea TaxID=2952225 RepID=A0ABT1THY4_9GAMM|nr:hypothetical protein [Methylomonas sp. SURF-2]MCQ8105045.1 hypothetical protein [Methylomonas sp. SURF-2]
MLDDENTVIETEQVDGPQTPISLGSWHTPELKSIQIGVATEALCDASSPCT